MNIIGEDIVLKAYFTNNLNLIIDSLINKTRKSKKDVLSYINSIDYLYDEEDYQTKLKI
jgi:hypothetical protein